MRYLLLAALVIGSLLNAHVSADEPTIDRQMLSTLGQGFSYVPSPAPVDLVTVGPAGSRMAVYNDGEPGPRFDEIVATQPTPEGGGGIAVIFSADGSRSAYVGRVRNEFKLIVDGEEVATGKYDGAANTISGVGFHADNHLFYRIRQQDEQRNAPWQFVMDGQPSPRLATNQFQVMLSPVGKGYVLIGMLDETRARGVILAAALTRSASMRWHHADRFCVRDRRRPRRARHVLPIHEMPVHGYNGVPGETQRL